MSIYPFLLLVCFFSNNLNSQPAVASALPKVHFTFDHPGLAVTHYELEIDSRGIAHYESKSKGSEQGTTDDGITRDFSVSPETRDRIFGLIKATNNLDGSFDYTRHKIAFTGTRTITLTDADGAHTAKFMWSENPNITALADVFQGISATLEEEPVLQRLRKYDPLGLNAELEKMEKAADSGWLRELNLIAPLLQDLAADSTIMSVARKRAGHLFKLASATRS